MSQSYPPVVMNTDLPLPAFIKGKVRDTYDLGKHLLIVATDRISAFDVVLPTGIPAKGMVLNQLSVFWFRHTAEMMPNHLVAPVDDVKILDEYLPKSKRFAYPDYLAGRAMIVKKVKRLPVECVVRGYIAGSAWTEYRQEGTISGVPMPTGIRESEELPQPIFTPTTKADSGHDEAIEGPELFKLVGMNTAIELDERSLKLYHQAREYAIQRGIIIADTKFEFGVDGRKLIVIDEMLTPDSSRFWDVGLYQVGRSQPSLDKQPVRDWLANSGWKKEPPAPTLPEEVIEATAQGYLKAYEKLTGQRLL